MSGMISVPDVGASCPEESDTIALQSEPTNAAKASLDCVGITMLKTSIVAGRLLMLQLRE